MGRLDTDVDYSGDPEMCAFLLQRTLGCSKDGYTAKSFPRIVLDSGFNTDAKFYCELILEPVAGETEGADGAPCSAGSGYLTSAHNGVNGSFFFYGQHDAGEIGSFGIGLQPRSDNSSELNFLIEGSCTFITTVTSGTVMNVAAPASPDSGAGGFSSSKTGAVVGGVVGGVVGAALIAAAAIAVARHRRTAAAQHAGNAYKVNDSGQGGGGTAGPLAATPAGAASSAGSKAHDECHI